MSALLREQPCHEDSRTRIVCIKGMRSWRECAVAYRDVERLCKEERLETELLVLPSYLHCIASEKVLNYKVRCKAKILLRQILVEVILRVVIAKGLGNEVSM